MSKQDAHTRFDRILLPHLTAAYNLARWLTRNDEDARDMVQEACLRAFRALDSFRGEDARAWLLAIVRNTCYTWLQRNCVPATVFEEEIHGADPDAADPEQLLLESAGAAEIKRAMEELPAGFREVIVLREMEGLSYREISEITGAPLGTIMSRLARARRRLQELLAPPVHREAGQ